MLLAVRAASEFAIVGFIKERKNIPTYIDITLHHIKQNMKLTLQDFQSDNAKDYISANMQRMYNEHHVQHHLRTAHQSQENGIAERLNRTIIRTSATDHG